jgi:hypothetical protein
MWRNVRILVLLSILLFVALSQYTDRVRSTDWSLTLRVALIPIRADESNVTGAYVEQLSPGALEPLQEFFREEARRYALTSERPIRFQLAPRIDERPPALDPGAGAVGAFFWSLRARYWAWRVGDVPGPSPNVKLFVLYHDPARSASLAHSVGLQKGLFGIVNVFADSGMAGSNDVVIAHELMHTLGATDKYGLADLQPLFPIGYAEPTREPLYPQRLAELMGGRIPTSQQESQIPESLHDVLIGPLTAGEIGWARR